MTGHFLNLSIKSKLLRDYVFNPDIIYDTEDNPYYFDVLGYRDILYRL